MLRVNSDWLGYESQPDHPLPADTGALRSLRELRVMCHYQPMPPLALPALEVLQLDAALCDGEVSPAPDLCVGRYQCLLADWGKTTGAALPCCHCVSRSRLAYLAPEP